LYEFALPRLRQNFGIAKMPAKTAASWLHQLAREAQICSQKGRRFIARCAAREREASSAGWTASALQGVLPGGRGSRGAGSPSKLSRDILGEGHFPDMSHGLRCARMRIAWNHSKFDARDTSPGTRVSQNFLSDFFSGCNAYAQERQSWVMAGQTL